MWNRIGTLIVLITATTLILTQIEIEARGGRGGGSGSRGAGGAKGGGARESGAYRGGNTMNRTPTMSRASNRTAIPQTKQQIQAKSSIGKDRVQQSRQTVQQRPSATNRAELRNQVNQYAKNRPAQNADHQSIAQKTQNFSNSRSNQISQNRQLSQNLSQRVQQSLPDSKQWFNQNFFDRHNLEGNYLGTGANFWRPAAWASLATWGAWNWSTPYYYDDGYAYPITTESPYAYPSGTTTTSSDQVQTQPMQTIQTPVAASGDWLPLGVFAITGSPNTSAQPHHFIQLAVNRKGEIDGVLYNSLTDAAQDLTGTVNTTTQMAYWSLANRPGAPVASTGIYNLTEDETPINVHFSDGSDQTWALVRLQQEQ